MRLKLIACEILYREFCSAVARSPNLVDVEFLPKGLHDIGQAEMSGHLQEVLGKVDEAIYEAVLFGYGLCSNGLIGLAARTIPLVLPRAHDCITLFLSSTERYLDYFQTHTGMYFKTSGWIERGKNLQQLRPQSIQQKTGMTYSYDELVEKYGEDNAKYLYEKLCDPVRNYGGYTFIEMGTEPDDRFERATREEAQRLGWKFEKLQGDMTLIHHLVDGPWPADKFLVVEPGCRVAASFDDQIIKAEKSA